jgi:hypothetical protein
MHKLVCADIKYTTVVTLALQFSADVLFLDYYILNTPTDLERDSFGGINAPIWGGTFLWLTAQLGCLRHHGLLRGLREQVDDSKSKRIATGCSHHTAPSGKRKRAERKAARRTNTGNSKDSSTPDSSAADEAKACVLGYRSPAGLSGGFHQCCCPHYAYEILCWAGLAFVGRHVIFWALVRPQSMIRTWN